MTLLLIGLITFAAAVVQSASGFGGALVAMPLLLPLLGPKVAVPLMVVAALGLQLGLSLRFRAGITWAEVLRLGVSGLLGVPVGLLLLERLDQRVLMLVLATVVLGYVAYAWRERVERPPVSRRWAVLAGFSAGVLGGAVNAGGPPAVVYAALRRWPSDTFKGNLQVLFLTNTLMISVGHLAAGNISGEVLRGLIGALPGMLLGSLAGLWLASKLDEQRFRRLVLVLLIALGAQLLLRAALAGG